MIFKKKSGLSEFGIFTDKPISAGTVLFSYDEWVEDEVLGWSVLDLAQLDLLPVSDRERFLRYAYDVDFGKIIGTFNWDYARNISNFMNHSCDPNMMYDTGDNIIARREIRSGEELTVDYGCFVVNVDQDFICSCGSSNCRKMIRKDDWKFLVSEYGYHFPTFMHNEIRKFLINKSA